MLREEGSGVKFPLIRAYHHKEDPSIPQQFSRRSKSELFRDFIKAEYDSNRGNKTIKPIPYKYDILQSFQVSPRRSNRDSQQQVGEAAQEIPILKILDKAFLSNPKTNKNGLQPKAFNFLEKMDKITAVIKACPSLSNLYTEKSETRFLPFNSRGRDQNEGSEEKYITNETHVPIVEDSGGFNIKTFITSCNIPLIDELVFEEKNRSAHMRSISLDSKISKEKSQAQTLYKPRHHQSHAKINLRNLSHMSNNSLLDSSQNTQISNLLTSRILPLNNLLDDPILMTEKGNSERKQIGNIIENNSKYQIIRACKEEDENFGKISDFAINDVIQKRENRSCTDHINNMLKARKSIKVDQKLEQKHDEIRKKNEIKVILNQAENIKQLRLVSKLIKKQLEIEGKKSNKFIDDFKEQFNIS